MSIKPSLVYGLHALTHLLAQQPERILQLYVAKERVDKKMQTLVTHAKAQHIAVLYVTREKLDTLTQELERLEKADRALNDTVPEPPEPPRKRRKAQTA